jgi:dihydrofolate synthase/folylpolyglutamate synthase
MNYAQTIDFLYGQLPMFHRIGKAAYKADLNNTIALCDHIGNPQRDLKCIHIAGTNGKGSTSHMLSAIFQSLGLKTGLYTSPHLKDFRERIKINGQMIPEEAVTGFVEKNLEFIEELKPSFFELTVAMCFDYFAAEKIDIAIIETGLGGRLDSTNIITPLLSVITNISYDHTDLLGNTLQAIAAEKAGIIKLKVPVIIGETHIETADVFIEKAKQETAKIVFADQVYEARNTSNNNNYMHCDIYSEGKLLFEKLQCDLTGIYQQKNICTVIAATEEIKKLGYTPEEKVIRNGLANVKNLSGLMGRWQVLSDHPLTICDTGHNRDGMAMVMKQLNALPYKKLHIVFGMVNDKDPATVLELLPKDAEYYFCKAGIPRALDPLKLQKQAGNYGLNGDNFSTVAEAYKAAQNKADANDVIFIGGSTFVVAEVL